MYMYDECFFGPFKSCWHSDRNTEGIHQTFAATSSTERLVATPKAMTEVSRVSELELQVIQQLYCNDKHKFKLYMIQLCMDKKDMY